MDGVLWRSVKGLTFSEEEWTVLRREMDLDIEFDTFMVSSSQKDTLTVWMPDKRKIREPRKPCALPLAPITNARLDFAKIRKLAVPPDGELEELYELVEGTRLVELIREYNLTHPPPPENRSVSHHLLRDLPGLLEQQVFVRGRFVRDVTLWVPLFKVPKAGNEDARLIGDCRPVNERLPKPPPMKLEPLHTILRRLLRRRYLFQTDAQSYFYQFVLGEPASSVFGVRVGGPRGIFETARWGVMPMGWSFAPAIAQRTSNLLCENTCVLCPSVDAMPWVDNFLFGADSLEDLQAGIDTFHRISSEVGLALKKEDPPARHLQALGLYLNVESDRVEEHYVELVAEKKEAMRSALMQLRREPTARSLFRVFGNLMWGFYAVTHVPLSRYPVVMAEVRKTASQVMQATKDAWDKPIQLSYALDRELESMVDLVHRARLTLEDLEAPALNQDAWSDASGRIRGWGHVWEDVRGIQAAAELHDIPDIFVAELLAAANTWYTSAVEGFTPLLYVDNSGAAAALVKGHSRNAAGDLILRRLHESLPEGSKASVAWLPTDCQRADNPSRGIRSIPERCHCTHPARPVAWTVRSC
jgi:hypothetical protein